MTDQKVSLHYHPTTPCPSVQAIDVRISSTIGGGLALDYRLSGNLGELRIPVPRAPRCIESLWEHTCFEAFIGAGSAAYYEFNFSPSGEWAVFSFSGYRQRAAAGTLPLSPEISTHRMAEHLEVNVNLAAELLPRAEPGTSLTLGLSAVIEAADSTRSYWALAHGGARPDFHDRSTFTLTLPHP